MKINRHGLARYIPSDVRRQIRQECGFGCILCGLLPYQYDHFDPEFAEATLHDPNKIALLCGNHHDEKTAGRISNALISLKRSKPFNRNDKSTGPVWRPVLDPAIDTVVVCGVQFTNCEAPGLSINGEVVFAFERDDDGQWQMDGALCDDEGDFALRFDASEIRITKGRWDTTLEGRFLTIRSGPRRISLQLELDANNKLIALRRINMSLANGYRVYGDQECLIVNGPRPLGVELRRVELRNMPRHFVLLPVGTRLQSDKNVAINIPELGKWDDWISATPQPANSSSGYSRLTAIDATAELDALWNSLVSSQRDELLLAACFAPEWIHADLLAHSTLNGGAIIRLGLALSGPEQGSIKIFPEVTSFLRGKLSSGDDASKAAVLRFLNGCFISLRAWPVDSSAYRRYAQSKAHYDEVQSWHGNMTTAASLLSEYWTMVAVARRQLGLLAEALDAAKIAVSFEPSNDHARAGLAMTLVDAGMLQEAESIYRSMIDTDPVEAVFKKGDLANLLKLSGRVEEALALAVEVHETMLATFGAMSIHTARAMNARGSVLQAVGRFDEAEPFLEEAIKVFEALDDVPRLITARSNRAAGMEAKGKFEDAQREYNAILELSDENRGATHPEVVVIRQNLAFLLRRRGELTGALQEYHRALWAALPSMSPDHPTVQYVAANIVDLLREAPALRGSGCLLQLLREGPIVPGYPMGAHYDHAIVYGRVLLGLMWYDDALQLYRAGADAARGDFGAGSYQDLLFRSNAALCLRYLGREAEFIKEYSATLQEAEVVLGPDAPYVAHMRKKLRQLMASE